ncbi:hypothetical protein C8034_v002367 [Colletotrichum sidae]|uniref:Uncharacterized protein n=2 Tax=Colletotrichum orbiculare species complex TaxID=2707354 RepID=A0A4V3HWG1_COLTR|nr:hypothetical protein CTRI78_v004706 [Colletotrichum trifolii]TEA15199.1 hypothetical protein C8034_v002367 [Colletotrichum sidae]
MGGSDAKEDKKTEREKDEDELGKKGKRLAIDGWRETGSQAWKRLLRRLFSWTGAHSKETRTLDSASRLETSQRLRVWLSVEERRQAGTVLVVFNGPP